MHTVLIVDDEYGIRELLSEILEDEGYQVLTAENAKIAQSLVGKHDFDLILLDIWMPDMDGISLLKEWYSHNTVRCPIVMMSGPSSSGKTSSSLRIAQQARVLGLNPKVIELDNYFVNRDDTPLDENGQRDFEALEAMDVKFLNEQLDDLLSGKEVKLPKFDFVAGVRVFTGETMKLQPNDILFMEGIHALNPELTGLVKGDDVYRIYAGLREEYCIDGRRVINTQDIRLCRRTLRDAAARGRSPAKTLAMWDRVLDGETRYIKGFKTTADFLLDTSFTYELGLIAKLLRPVSQRFTLEGNNAELWDETARRFEHVAPVELELLPADSMLREFYAGEV